MTAGITTQAEPMTATDIKRSDMIAKINALGEGDVAVLITRSKANTGITSDISAEYPNAWTLLADLLTLVYTRIVLPKAQVEYAKGSGGNGAPPVVSA